VSAAIATCVGSNALAILIVPGPCSIVLDGRTRTGEDAQPQI
jgi:Ca2+/Na+ antiporter